MSSGIVLGGSLRCRKSPSTSADVWGSFSNGTVLTVTATSSADWYQTTWNGSVGYVMKAYVAIAGDTVKVNGSNVNVRNSPSTSGTSVLYTLSSPITASVKGVTSDWVQIQPSGRNAGWISAKYVDKTSNGSSTGDNGTTGSSINTATWAQVKNGSAVYKKESSGTAVCEGVKTLQRYLIDIGWGRAAVLGTSSDLTVDGNFGTKTEKAVKNFQYECGLSEDGVVGSQTAGKLDAAHSDANFTTKKFHPLSESEWSYAGLPSWVDDISLCARLICAEHSRNGYPTGDEDARAGIAKVLRNRKNSSNRFNEVGGLKTFKAIIFGTGQFNPATGEASSRKMARFVWRGAGNNIPWQQAITYATKLVNGQSIARAAKVTNHLYFNGYTDKWSTAGKYNIIYYPDESTKKFTAFFNR